MMRGLILVGVATGALMAALGCGEGSDAPRCRNVACGNGAGPGNGGGGEGGEAPATGLAFIEAWGSASGAKVRDVAIDDDGNVYAIGFYTTSISFGDFDLTTGADGVDMFLVKVDRGGDVVWAHHFGQDQQDVTISDVNRLWASIAIIDDKLILGGPVYETTVLDTQQPDESMMTAVDAPDVFVAALDLDGGYLWKNQFGINAQEPAVRDIAVGGGSVYVTGDMRQIDFPDGLAQTGVYTMRLDADDGSMTWATSLTSIDANTTAEGVSVDGDGNVAIGGYFRNGLTDPDDAGFEIQGPAMLNAGFLAVFDADGNTTALRSTEVPGGNGASKVSKVVFNSEGDLYVVGSNEGTLEVGGDIDWDFSDNQGFVLKMNTDLEAIWGVAVTSTPPPALVHHASLGPNDAVDVVGQFNGLELNVGSRQFAGNGDHDIFYARIDKDGETGQGAVYGGDGHQIGWSVDTNAAGEVAFGGHMYGTLDGPGYLIEGDGAMGGEEDVVIGMVAGN